MSDKPRFTHQLNHPKEIIFVRARVVYTEGYGVRGMQ